TCTGGDDDHVYVDAQSNSKTLVYRGNAYPMSFRLGRYDGEWQLHRGGTSVYGDAPPTYRKAITAEVLRVVGTFLELHPHLLVEAERASVNNDLGRLEKKIYELEVELAEKRAAAASLEMRLNEIVRSMEGDRGKEDRSHERA